MQLSELPKQIEDAEYRVIEHYSNVQTAKENLTFKEDELMLSGVIDDKNAETRAAQMRENTTKERQELQLAENTLSKKRVALNRLNNRLAVCKAIAGMLGKGDE
jgi:hypothetical protein